MMADVVENFGPGALRCAWSVSCWRAARAGAWGAGVPKPLRLLGGRPMVAHVVERLRPQVMDLVIVANDPDPAYRALGAEVIADPPDVQQVALREGRRLGPLAGILAGMEWSVAHHPHAGWILTASRPMCHSCRSISRCGYAASFMCRSLTY